MPWKLTRDPAVTTRAVERQMRNWELASRQRRGEDPRPRPEVADFITLSRQVGVPAEDVAVRLGDELGWPVFGRNLLDAMAGDDAVRHRIYRSLDQRDLKWWEEALYGLFGEGFVRNDYFRRLCETVLSLARQGSCVFIGRGCDRLLPANLGYRVRLVAPYDQRLENLRRLHDLTEREAAERAERIEQERDVFLRHHFNVAADEPTRHDLVLNLGRMGVEEAAATILAGRGVRQRRRTAA